MERRRFIVHGRVQGVGFRATAVRLASSFAVTGQVKNLPQGTVELLVQGEPAEIDRFMAAVGERFAGGITRLESEALAVVADEKGFRMEF